MKIIWAIFRFVAVLAALFFPQLASAGEHAPKAETRVWEIDVVLQTSLQATSLCAGETRSAESVFAAEVVSRCSIGSRGGMTTTLAKHPFSDGGTHLTTTKRLDYFKAKGSTTYGSPDDGLFVAPRGQVDDLLARASSRTDIEVALGLDKGALRGGKLVRIDVDDAFKHGLRPPEGGNIYHRPGTGQTMGNLFEGVVNAPRVGTRGVRKKVVRGK